MKIVATILCLVAFALAIGAKPARDIPAPAAKQKDPPAWECQFGVITQKGDAVVIQGNPGWFAEGHIRKDGKLLVCWTRLDSELRTAAGLYTWKDESSWGWSEAVELDELDNLKGPTNYERLYRVNQH